MTIIDRVPADIACELDEWRAARRAAARGASYSIDGVNVTRQPLAQLDAQISRLIREYREAVARREGATVSNGIRVAEML